MPGGGAVGERVVAVLGTGLVDAAAPLLRADDQGLLRGDGCFESVLVRAGVPIGLEPHLARFAGSAARLDLPAPDLAGWRDLAVQAVAAWRAGGEAVLRLVLTRGPESGGAPTGFAMVTALPDRALRQRTTGVHVLSLARGVPSDAPAAAPWLLAGAKTLSYAVNMAAVRYAEAKGADDVIFTSTEGRVLEGPTSTVVWSSGGTLYTVPTTEPILDGVTVRELFAALAGTGMPTAVAAASVPDLHAAAGLWLVSSIRRIAAVRSLDGRPCPDSPDSPLLGRALGVQP
jgi:4-amino-4-deoxychorismate lyase